jgi:RIO-like serine/threonine protein kinase
MLYNTIIRQIQEETKSITNSVYFIHNDNNWFNIIIDALLK